MQYIKGPDFPTGGSLLLPSHSHKITSSVSPNTTDSTATATTVVYKNGLESLYHTGKGSVQLRANYHFEQQIISKHRNKTSIIVTEIPYLTNKAGKIIVVFAVYSAVCDVIVWW